MEQVKVTCLNFVSLCGHIESLHGHFAPLYSCFDFPTGTVNSQFIYIRIRSQLSPPDTGSGTTRGPILGQACATPGIKYDDS